MVWFENSVIVMAEVQEKHDKFCWKCCGKETTLKCSSCVRSFHDSCAPSETATLNKQWNIWKCPVCVKLKNAEHSDKKSDLAMLPIVIEKALHDKSFDLLKNETFVTESIVNPLDLTKIRDTIDKYTSFDEFLADIQWIVHNCFILFLDNHGKMEIAKSLVDYLEVEIESVKKCSECYSNEYRYPSNWFTMVCSEPHLVVWAKKTGFYYVPAKLYSIDGQLINVRFFDDHKPADVPATNCILYSEINPNRSRNTSSSYKSAMKETDVYVKNARKKFGSFNFIETKIAFNPSLLEKYIGQVIPELAKSPMLKTIRAKVTGTDQKKPKTNENEPNNRIEQKANSLAILKKYTPMSPKKSLVINITRLSHDKVSCMKRHKLFSNDVDEPADKKKRLTTSTPKVSKRPLRKASDSVDSAQQTEKMNTTIVPKFPEMHEETIELSDSDKSDESAKSNGGNKSADLDGDAVKQQKSSNGDQLQFQLEEPEIVETEKVENDVLPKKEEAGVSPKTTQESDDKVKTTQVNDKAQPEIPPTAAITDLNTTDPEGTKEKGLEVCQSDVPDKAANAVAQPSTTGADSNVDERPKEEPTVKTEHANGFDWARLIGNGIEETVKSMTVNMCVAISNKMRPEFDALTQKLALANSERDQIAVAAEQAKLQAQKQIAEVNEKQAEAIANAKKDAANFWSGELTKVKTQADHDIREANRLLTEKLTEATQKIATIEANADKDKEALNQMLFDLREQHKLELAAEKQRSADEIEGYVQTHLQTFAEMERKVKQANEEKMDVESQLKAKYRDIIAGIKEQAETERSQQSICVCCKKPLQIKRVCSPECEEMWGLWNDNNTSQSAA